MALPQIKAIVDEYRFRIVRKIADGGMGSVYEAVQDGASGFQKTVALKTILPDLADSGTFVDYFVQEAKLVANLVHENIVQIYQLGRALGGYYMIMEFVNGLSLHEFIRTHKIMRDTIPMPLGVFIASRIARGLTYAHTRLDPAGDPMHIVHRDVCTGNILITTEGLPKLTDFGIALVGGNLLGSGRRVLAGKAPYMSPEQANQEPVDHRTDIFSLGAVLFELLSMHKIRSEDESQTMVEQARAGRVDWEQLPPDLPPEVRAILEKCLAADRNDRYAKTADLARDLEYYIYKDGYGPTIQTLETYLREKFEFLYRPKKRVLLRPPGAKTLPPPPNEALTIYRETQLKEAESHTSVATTEEDKGAG